jgi:hypothetical protein
MISLTPLGVICSSFFASERKTFWHCCHSFLHNPNLLLPLSFVFYEFVCIHETIASALCVFVLCILPKKRHLPSPMLSTPLLYAFLQENDINTAIANLHSLRLCYVCLSKKMMSMPRSPTYAFSASILCTSPRKRYQHCHCYSSHENNWLFLTLNQKFLDLLCLHVVGLWLAIENGSCFCLVCIPTSLLPKVFIRIWST